LTGIGFGRGNDFISSFSGEKGIVYTATRGIRVFSPKTAHNSLFQVLQETGLVGLFLMGYLWLTLYLRLRKNGMLEKGDDYYSALNVACRALVVFVFGCSLTGHALGSPAIGIAPLTIIGLLVAYDRRKNNRVPRPQEAVRLAPLAAVPK
jgi:O-antigen ligase